MPKYRKKPVVIEAYLLSGDSMWDDPDANLPEWLQEAIEKGVVYYKAGGTYIYTLEGDLHAEHGDWIIQGVKGELYPCKPDIFEATYEEVSE